MKLKIDNQEEECDFSGTVASLVMSKGLLLEEVIVRVNGSIAPETKVVGPQDRVEILKVVFGG